MYCQHCGKETKKGQVVCDECKKQGISDSKSLDNTYIEQIEPDELDLKAKGPVHPVKGKGIASMTLGIVSLTGFILQITVPGGIFSLLACAILSLVFAKHSVHTRGKGFGNVGTITGTIALTLILIQVVLTIIALIIFILIFGLSAIIAILGAIFSALAYLIGLVIK